MVRYAQRPEKALKRANEFIEDGKPLRALDTLKEVFRMKPWNLAFSDSIIEPLMYKYLYLCVELKKSHIAKDGLLQYRKMVQPVNVSSLENVIRAYLRMAEEHTEAARAEPSAAVALLELNYFDNISTREDAQDRSDLTILLPWVKFLWESYCQCLDLLRINTHCEALYHDIARMTFNFCLKYNRKSEFCRLSEKLRNHLKGICKSTNQNIGVSITKLETQQLWLDTILFQSDCAIQMELWQEAYKVIEDIHGLMTLSKETPVHKTMANYYQKLSMVFSKGGNQLFHAAALLKLFQLMRELKTNLRNDDTRMQRMASHVLIATLSIPLHSAHSEFEIFFRAFKSPLEKAQKLATLLGVQEPPTRALLLKEMVRLNVPQLAFEEYRNLYNALEVDFNPLNLCKRLQSVVNVIEGISVENNPLASYIHPLKDVTIMRLIHQISQVYESIEFNRFFSLASFCNIFDLEKLLVESVRHNDMKIRIDHQKRCIYFGTYLTESQRGDHPDGPNLQSMQSEQIRSQLVNMSSVLHRAVSIVYPNRERDYRDKKHTQMVQHYNEIKNREHQRILQRQKIIENRIAFIEKQNNARKEEEASKAKLAEQKRLEQKNEKEIQAIKEKNIKQKVQISQTAHGKKMLGKIDAESIKKLIAEKIAAKESEELQGERKELQNKPKSQQRKIDYFERRKRMKFRVKDDTEKTSKI